MRPQINNPFSGGQPKQFNEFSALRSPREADSPNRQHLKHQDNAQSLNQALMASRQVISTLNRLRTRGGQSLGGGGWKWQIPFELDPTVAVPGPDGNGTMTAVYISALNPLVVTGMTDLVTNANVKSCQGIWLANQAVPATAASKYNVPVFPYPAGAAVLGGGTFLMGTTAPSGTPLIGDLDLIDPATGLPIRFWTYLGDVT
jgi:hypothetical protein